MFCTKINARDEATSPRDGCRVNIAPHLISTNVASRDELRPTKAMFSRDFHYNDLLIVDFKESKLLTSVHLLERQREVVDCRRCEIDLSAWQAAVRNYNDPYVDKQAGLLVCISRLRVLHEHEVHFEIGRQVLPSVDGAVSVFRRL